MQKFVPDNYFDYNLLVEIGSLVGVPCVADENKFLDSCYLSESLASHQIEEGGHSRLFSRCHCHQEFYSTNSSFPFVLKRLQNIFFTTKLSMETFGTFNKH